MPPAEQTEHCYVCGRDIPSKKMYDDGICLDCSEANRDKTKKESKTARRIHCERSTESSGI